jgi:hypothetical protein
MENQVHQFVDSKPALVTQCNETIEFLADMLLARLRSKVEGTIEQHLRNPKLIDNVLSQIYQVREIMTPKECNCHDELEQLANKLQQTRDELEQNLEQARTDLLHVVSATEAEIRHDMRQGPTVTKSGTNGRSMTTSEHAGITLSPSEREEQDYYDWCNALDDWERSHQAETAANNIPKFKREILGISLSISCTKIDLQGMYNAIATTMAGYGLPIRKLSWLKPGHTALPEITPLSDNTLALISSTLYLKLGELIPNDHSKLRPVYKSFTKSMDGYACLFGVMRLYCDYLQDLPPTWGPDWNTDMSAYTYMAELDSIIQERARQHIFPSRFQIAAEVLQQATRVPRYAVMASAYMSQLLQHCQDQRSTPATFDMEQLLLSLEANTSKNTDSNMTPVPHSNPSIFKFQQRPRFEHKNKKQCKACKRWGHCIEDNTCHASAQWHFCKEFSEQDSDKARRNAKAYAIANNKTTVKHLQAKFPEAFEDKMTEEEMDDARCTLAQGFVIMSEVDMYEGGPTLPAADNTTQN